MPHAARSLLQPTSGLRERHRPYLDHSSESDSRTAVLVERRRVLTVPSAATEKRAKTTDDRRRKRIRFTTAARHALPAHEHDMLVFKERYV